MKRLFLTFFLAFPLLVSAGDPLAPLEPLDHEIMRPPPFPKKWETNLSMLTITAEKGSAEAQYNLAAHYIFAVGTTQDLTKAYRWLTNSAGKDFPPAQYTLGLLYKQGVGVVSNQIVADAWFQIAADQGYTPARHEMALKADREGNRSLALKLLHETAEKGYPSSQYLLGCIVPDPIESYLWLSLAAEGGLENAGNRALQLRLTFTKEQLTEAEERLRKFKEKQSAKTPMPP